MPVIKRYLSNSFLQSFKVDFKNLIKIVNNSYGELDLAIRENYLNLYYKGNSLAKISARGTANYQISVHEKFFNGTKADSNEFFENKKQTGNYVHVTLTEQKPPIRFLQKAHINQLCSRVNQVNYGEEIVFEQAIITDNMDREDLVIIDRQISDRGLKGKRLDLIGLKQIRNNEYQFLVIEVKLGKNPELREVVAIQLRDYVNHIEDNIRDYQECYQKQYEQKKTIGLLTSVPFEKIHITDKVDGLVVVGGYSKMAEASVSQLAKRSKDVQVVSFSYKLLLNN